jgi:hypothetical protein
MGAIDMDMSIGDVIARLLSDTDRERRRRLLLLLESRRLVGEIPRNRGLLAHTCLRRIN